MSVKSRIAKDKLFSLVSTSAIILLVVTLLIVLSPILFRGAQAVVFVSSVEFRRLQYDMHGRGDEAQLQAEIAEYERKKGEIFDVVNDFSEGIDTNASISRIRDAYREYGRELRYKNVSKDDYTSLRAKAKQIRDLLTEAMESDDLAQAKSKLLQVEKSYDQVFADTDFAVVFDVAAKYGKIIEEVDLSLRDTYTDEIIAVRELLNKLFGPAPREDEPVLIMEKYGATRFDYADKLINQITHKDVWQSKEGSKELVKVRVSRADVFAGTPIEKLINDLPTQAREMLKPQLTFYWQYFIDDSTPGHFFGGVGPEIIGTLMLTVIAMLIAIPLGIISAAYLTECATDNIATKIIRMSINTLAGVPSIVFGLFGMTFFVLFLLPAFGQPSKACILTASMTLSILVLPVIIRSSEEAIKSVPQAYKQASLSLGAGKFKTFVKVTLPAAMPGILTGIILSLSRAAGETAPILFTGAVALGPIPESIFQPTRALSYSAYDMAVGDRIAMLVPHQQYGIVATLVMLVLLLNLVAILIRSKISKRLRES